VVYAGQVNTGNLLENFTCGNNSAVFSESSHLQIRRWGLHGGTDPQGGVADAHLEQLAKDDGWRRFVEGPYYDIDNDKLPDYWEREYFGNLSNTATGDNDGDGISNLQEYLNGTDPTKKPVKNDFNGDGKADILLRNIASGEWNLALLDGLTVLNQGGVSGSLNNSPGVTTVSTGDFNGDGKADILTRDTGGDLLPGTFHIDLMDGMNIVESAWFTTMSTDLNDEVMSTKDFNKDGKADVLLRNKVTGVWTINYMNGTSAPTIHRINIGKDLCYTIKGDGDYDGDGYPDILLRKDACGGTAYPWKIILTNGGFVVKSKSVLTGLNKNPDNIVVVANKDFNGDGKADVLMRDSTGSPQKWRLYVMNGTAPVTGTLVNLEVQSMWQFAAVADFNGDGKADILLREVDTGQWLGYLMDGSTVLASGVINIPLNQIFTLQALDDYNGDGKCDILIRNGASGMWYMNLMDGLTVQSQGVPLGVNSDISSILQNH
jgi:hypothetical protein